MTLTEFLLARIAEDEAAAREGEEVGVHPGYFDDHFGARMGDYDRGVYAGRFDPARMLAECEAKRRIVADCRVLALAPDAYYASFARSMLASLAAVYADHPDYDEAWRP